MIRLIHRFLRWLDRATEPARTAEDERRAARYREIKSHRAVVSSMFQTLADSEARYAQYMAAGRPMT